MEGRIGGGGARKIGRSARKPAHKRYNAEMRWVKNKMRKVKKQARFEEKKRKKKAARGIKHAETL